MATHLTATMSVLRFHFHRPSLTVADAQEAVKELALRVGTEQGTEDDAVLEAKLKKATGVDVAQLAHYAEDWPS